MNQFRTLLLDIGQHITKDNLQSLKFACSSFIPAGRAEAIKQPLELFLEMERQNKLTENNRQLLADLLVKIGRSDLRNKLLELPDEPPPGQQETRRQTTTRLSTVKVSNHMLVELNLPEKISTSWKFLGRHLKLKDYVIRNIEDTYRRTEERSNEMLTKWLQMAEDTSVIVLVTALKNVGRTDLAEEVEEYYTPFPAMAEIGHNLPAVGQPVRGNQAQPAEHDGQPQEHPQEGQETDGVVPDRASLEQVEQGPIQVSGDQEDDLKKTGSFLDQNVYRIEDLLGSGGFSKVYCVRERKTNKLFAVKTVELGLQDRITQEKVEALEKEVSMLRVLDNPYVVKYFKTEVFKDLVGVIMEYMSGGSIAQKILKEGRIDEDTVRRYTWQLLNGLQYLHSNRVIHRDIKGANILLDKQHKYIKLTDFGISLTLEGIATSTGHCVSNREGTMASVYWTSPELLASDKYSFNTDIWSLGCTVIEMLTGDPPLRRDGLILVQVMYKISNFQVNAPECCSINAKEFLDMCFMKRDQRPSASELLRQTGSDVFPIVCSD